MTDNNDNSDGDSKVNGEKLRQDVSTGVDALLSQIDIEDNDETGGGEGVMGMFNASKTQILKSSLPMVMDWVSAKPDEAVKALIMLKHVCADILDEHDINEDDYL